jgi:protein-disulfide isomerase-like protein with CxxC motif
MTAKTITAIVISITILFVLLVTKVSAEEVKQPIDVKIKSWVVNEWKDIKEYQADSWQSSKDQLARNKEQILNLFSKIANN